MTCCVVIMGGIPAAGTVVWRLCTVGGGVVVVLSFAGSITASAARVVRASVSRENMGGGWYWLAQLKKALEPQTNERDWLYPNDNYW